MSAPGTKAIVKHWQVVHQNQGGGVAMARAIDKSNAATEAVLNRWKVPITLKFEQHSASLKVNTECNESTLLVWFQVTFVNQIIGVELHHTVASATQFTLLLYLVILIL